MAVFIKEYNCRYGSLLLGEEDGKLVLSEWLPGKYSPKPEYVAGTTPLLLQTESELDEYFAGRRQQFDIPLAVEGTAFQRLVWKAAASIPYGSVCTYKELAAAIGRPAAVRAVANALGANLLSVFIPCHRVVGTGFSGGYRGGIQIKNGLLDMEAAVLSAATSVK